MEQILLISFFDFFVVAKIHPTFFWNALSSRHIPLCNVENYRILVWSVISEVLFMLLLFTVWNVVVYSVKCCLQCEMLFTVWNVIHNVKCCSQCEICLHYEMLLLQCDLLLVSCDLIADVPLYRVADLHRSHSSTVTALLSSNTDTALDTAAPGTKSKKKAGTVLFTGTWRCYWPCPGKTVWGPFDLGHFAFRSIGGGFFSWVHLPSYPWPHPR